MKSESTDQHTLRIGAVSYLNSRPLIFQLSQVAPHAQLILDLPSRLADQLEAGRLDVALIPSIEYLRHPEYTIVYDACIACRGPVLSVKLLSRVAIGSIRSMALDEGSRTSIALARILLDERFGIRPELESLPIGGRLEDISADAVLLIGDRAISPPAAGFVDQWDLGQHWWQWSGLPFVFALWAARPGVDIERVGQTLATARDRGLTQLKEIAHDGAADVGLTTDACQSYLCNNLHFFFGPEEQEGLRLFHNRATALGLVPAAIGFKTFGLPTS